MMMGPTAMVLGVATVFGCAGGGRTVFDEAVQWVGDPTGLIGREKRR